MNGNFSETCLGTGHSIQLQAISENTLHKVDSNKKVIRTSQEYMYQKFANLKRIKKIRTIMEKEVKENEKLIQTGILTKHSRQQRAMIAGQNWGIYYKQILDVKR